LKQRGFQMKRGSILSCISIKSKFKSLLVGPEEIAFLVRMRPWEQSLLKYKNISLSNLLKKTVKCWMVWGGISIQRAIRLH
jgi:hypothetical protein